MERRGAGLRALGGLLGSRSSSRSARDSPLLRGRADSLPGEQERPVRLAPALASLPPPPPAPLAPASAGSRSPPLGELRTRKQQQQPPPPHPGPEPSRLPAGSKFSEARRGLPRLPDPGGVAHPGQSGLAGWVRGVGGLRGGGIPHSPPTPGAVSALSAHRSLLLAAGLAVRFGLEAALRGWTKRKDSRPTASKHLRRGRQPGERVGRTGRCGKSTAGSSYLWRPCQRVTEP